MNIAIFTDTYIPQINGVVEVIRGIRNGLEGKGHKVFIVAPRIKSFKDKDKRIIRVPSFPFPGLSEHRISFLYFRDINKKFIIKKKINIIHSQTPGTIGMIGIILARQCRIPHLHHYQTFFEDYAHYLKIPKPLSLLTIKNISRWFCNRVDMVTVPTYPFKSVLESYGIHKDVYVWASGIDLKRFRGGKNIRKQVGIPSDAFVLLYVGRLAREKNISFLLELLPYIRKKKKNIRLMIVGDGPLRSQLEEYAEELKISDLTIFTGAVSPDEVKNYYHSADIFVFSSLTETQGLVTLEALASGLPVVAVSAYGIKYVLKDGEGAFLVSLNRRTFLEKIQKLMHKRVYESMQKKGKAFVRNYTYAASTKKLMGIYNGLMDHYSRQNDNEDET